MWMVKNSHFLSNKQNFECKMIRKQLDELSDQNSYDFFDKNIGKEVVKEFLLNPNAMYLEAEEIYKKYQK